METFRIPKGTLMTSPGLVPLLAEIGKQAAKHKVKVTVQMDRANRSDDQNRLLWSLYTDIIRMGGEAMAGWTKDDLHELFLGLNFGWEVIEGFGQKRKKPMRRSSKLNKIEFTELVDSIVRFMAERGVALHLPGDVAP